MIKKFFYQLLFGTIAICTFPLAAYQLISIITVSKTENTFMLRLGKEQDITPGMEATFTSKHASIAAKAIEVSREYSVWKVLDPRIKVPFTRSQIITMHHGQERLWMLDPEEFSSEKIIAKWQADQVRRSLRRRDLYFRTSGSKGISGATSDAPANDIIGRDGFQLDFLFQQTLFSNFVGGMGLRYEREESEYLAVTTVSDRLYGLINTNYFFTPFEDSPGTSIYVGAEAGIGFSYTKIGKSHSFGLAYVFPGIHTGVDFLLSKSGQSLALEIGLETISTIETVVGGNIPQKSDVLNGKISAGFKQFF